MELEINQLLFDCAKAYCWREQISDQARRTGSDHTHTHSILVLHYIYCARARRSLFGVPKQYINNGITGLCGLLSGLLEGVAGWPEAVW
jgi:hypothetical protein